MGGLDAACTDVVDMVRLSFLVFQIGACLG